MENRTTGRRRRPETRHTHSFNKVVIKRLRIPPNWIRHLSEWAGSCRSNQILSSHKRKFGTIVFLAFFVFLCLKWQIICFKYQSQQVIDQHCDHYTSGEIHGNMCEMFCNSKNRHKEQLSPRNEANIQSGVIYPLAGCPGSTGKDIVFPAIISDATKVYVKGYHHTKTNDHVPLMNNEEGSELEPTTFIEMLNSYIRDNVGLFASINVDIKVNGLFLEKLFPGMTLENEDSKHTLSVMKTMWSLIQDDEYVFGKLSQDLNLFPTIYGSCGTLYVVEEIEPLSYKSSSFLAKEMSFNNYGERATVAMAIIDFLEELETLSEEPIHLCDIKLSHFGISKQGRVKFLDLDAIFAKSVLGKTMSQQSLTEDGGSNCTEHSDCSFFDCQGECDMITGKCRSNVANNNLQVVCEKIFLGRQYFNVGTDIDWLFKDSGFLVSRHANRKIKDLLQKCANPSNAADGTRIAASNKIKLELYKALEEIVNFMDDTENT